MSSGIVQRQDLFPLSVGLVARKPTGKGARARKRRRDQEGKETVVRECVKGVNALAGGGLLDPWVRTEFEERPPGVARERVVQVICSIADRAIRRGITLRADTRVPSKDGSYYCLEEKGCVFLDPDLVSLPPDGVAGQASFLELIPESVREFYAEEEALVRAEPEKAPKPFMGVASGKYKDLIKKLVLNGLVALQDRPPKIVNGVFAVPKDTSKHRLIIDARPANSLLVDPPETKLPNPGQLAELSFQDKGPLFVCKSDMDNCYHRLRMPEFLHQYFGLPPVTGDGRKMWPVVRVLPMGWSHSVYISQAIHEELVRGAGLDARDSFHHSESVEVGGMRHGEYIDDFFALGSDRELLASSLDRVMEAGRRSGLPPKESKKVGPGEMGETVVLGVSISEEGHILPLPDKLSKILTLSLQMLKFRTWNRKQLERLLGSWAWVLLLRRPLFSVVETLYDGKSGEGETFSPSRRMKQELHTLCTLAPFMQANLRRPYAKIVVATDASSKGGGVTYASISQHEILGLREGREGVGQFARSHFA